MKPDVGRKRLYLSKIGNVRVIYHRPIPGSRLKTCTVIRGRNGEWYASLVFDEVVSLQGIVVPESWKSPVGIDLGLKSLITTSDGEEVTPPKFLRRAEKRLKRLQKSLSRKQKGSKNRWRARQRVASVHAKVARQRTDFNHKLSSQFAQKHDFIAFEDLRVANMVKNHALAKSISDAAWGQLVQFTEYKAQSAGKLVVKVEPAYTTQECSYCGARNDVPLDVREFVCIGCGRTLKRDYNAARIVLKRGLEKALEQVGRGTPELKPVESRPPLLQSTGVASQPVEAGTICSGITHTQVNSTAGSPGALALGGCHRRDERNLG